MFVYVIFINLMCKLNLQTLPLKFYFTLALSNHPNLNFSPCYMIKTLTLCHTAIHV